MPRHWIASVVVSFALTGWVVAADAPMPRHPSPSPDASEIAFSWQGDLWLVPVTGGEARRITAHPATERHPIWSRDGRFIAFASDRHGNPDIFVMPADGSEPPRRLTFASVTDTPLDFNPDGSGVLFSSDRAIGNRWMPQLWRVPLAGGTPAMVQEAFAAQASYSPGGGSLVMVRGATKWTRRGYRGSANRELWFHDGNGDYVQLTHFDGDDDNPSWLGSHTLAFLSNRDGRKNIFKLDVVGGEATALTRHTGSGVRFPRASFDGTVIAYEFEDGIWTISPDDSEPTRLAIDVPADQLVNPINRRTDRDGADDLAVSPNGKLAAFIVHGDVFVTDIVSEDDQEIAKPPTVQVTDTPEREIDLSWSPDGDTLLFASARNGNLDLFTATRADEETGWTDSFEFETTSITSSPAHEHAARWAPDGARIAYVRGKGDLVVVSADGGDEIILHRHFDEPDFRWSPDGAWIAFASEDQRSNSEIFIIPSTGGEPYNVSRHPDPDLSPEWSPDGRRLVWASERHGDNYDIWAVWLTEADDQRTPGDWLKIWNGDDVEATDDDETGDDEDGDDPPELPKVAIDFDRLWQRSTLLTALTGDEEPVAVESNGKRIFFVGEDEDETDLYSIRFDGEDLQRLTEGDTYPDNVQLIDSETLFFLDSDGAISRIDLDGNAGDPVPFSARYVVDSRVERRVVFDEAWAALDLRFYDPEFHGVDWEKVRETYRPWALTASSDADFGDVLNLMLGELNASHMGYYPSRRGAVSDGDKTGWIGAYFDPQAGPPGLLVSEVLPGSPAARTEVAMAPGERLLAVNGRSIGAHVNVYDLFVDTVDQRVPARVLGVDGTERAVVLRPVSTSTQAQLRYEEWVRQRRRLVDEWSGGRLGYLHIQGMDIPSFEVFERDLFAAADGKDGLIIDVRTNGGGWTTDYLMAALMVQRHAYTIPRDADPDFRAYPTSERLPVAAWTRPALALCNEDSYSNAEIFAHAFKTLGRGPLVGSPTFGAVISTSSTGLINGGRVRLPLRGWYVAGTGLNMELGGARPDVIVWQPPAEDASAGIDTQLETAVRVRLDGLEEDPRYGAW